MSILGYFSESLSKICYGYSNINNLLLAPAAFYYGVFISYSYATFTQSFVSCAIGIQQVWISFISFVKFNTYILSNDYYKQNFELIILYLKFNKYVKGFFIKLFYRNSKN